MGRDKAEKIWKLYPILDYGKKWDMWKNKDHVECG